MEWQPIETAPKDDLFDVLATYYDLSGAKIRKRYVNIWHDGVGFVCGGTYLSGVTHWMPLPPPPKE